jgi:hypothetical protein
MIETEQTVLTPDEAGAFVAQWAEHHRISADELAKRLDVSEDQAISLMRQAKGRLAMEKWLSGKQPATARVFTKWPLIVGGVLVGAGLGAFLTATFWPSSTPVVAAAPLPPLGIQVQTMDPVRSSVASVSSVNGAPGGIPSTTTGTTSAPPAAIRSVHPSMTQIPGGFSMGRVSPPTEGKAPRVTRSTFRPGSPPFNETMPDRKPTNVNNLIKANIPADMIIEIRTSHGAMVINGQTTNNLRKAQAMRRESICEPLRALVGCFAVQGLTPGPGDTSVGSKKIQLEIWIGAAHVTRTLVWEPPGGGQVRDDINNPFSGFYDLLTPELSAQIRSAGTHLFLFPSRAPEIR